MSIQSFYMNSVRFLGNAALVQGEHQYLVGFGSGSPCRLKKVLNESSIKNKLELVRLPRKVVLKTGSIK